MGSPEQVEDVMKTLIAAVGIACAAPLALEDTKLGTGVALKEATAIAVLIERPREYVGKTIRVDGIATAVCEVMGCWMAVAAEGDEQGKTVRLKVEDGVIAFPVTAKGRKVSAEGVFEEIGSTDPHGQEAAGEHAAKDRQAAKRYHIKATGAIIR
jgi:Domain of unknown function (DUF4920)